MFNSSRTNAKHKSICTGPNIFFLRPPKWNLHKKKERKKSLLSFRIDRIIIYCYKISFEVRRRIEALAQFGRARLISPKHKTIVADELHYLMRHFL